MVLLFVMVASSLRLEMIQVPVILRIQVTMDSPGPKLVLEYSLHKVMRSHMMVLDDGLSEAKARIHLLIPITTDKHGPGSVHLSRLCIWIYAIPLHMEMEYGLLVVLALRIPLRIPQMG